MFANTGTVQSFDGEEAGSGGFDNVLVVSDKADAVGYACRSMMSLAR